MATQPDLLRDPRKSVPSARNTIRFMATAPAIMIPKSVSSRSGLLGRVLQTMSPRWIPFRRKMAAKRALKVKTWRRVKVKRLCLGSALRKMKAVADGSVMDQCWSWLLTVPGVTLLPDIVTWERLRDSLVFSGWLRKENEKLTLEII